MVQQQQTILHMFENDNFQYRVATLSNDNQPVIGLQKNTPNI